MRHKDARDRPPHHLAVRMQPGPAPLKLEVVAVAPQDGPRLFRDHPLHTAEDVIGHPGAPVLEPLPFPQRRQLDDVFPVVELHEISSFSLGGSNRLKLAYVTSNE